MENNTVSHTSVILPCSKCGGHGYAHTPDGQDEYENVRCRDCGHEGPTYRTIGGDYDAASLLGVIAWNRESLLPELLEALKLTTDQLERVGDSRKDAAFIERARLAIAKAEGEATLPEHKEVQ